MPANMVTLAAAAAFGPVACVRTLRIFRRHDRSSDLSARTHHGLYSANRTHGCNVEPPSMIMDSPVLQLLLIVAVAWVARHTLLRATPSPTAAGAIIMAIGIFGLASLPRIPAIPASTLQPFAIGLLVVWGFIGGSYLSSRLQGRMSAHTASPTDSFAVGTWVAGTAVLARVLLLGVPSWRFVALSLLALAFALWLWYLGLVFRGFRAILASTGRLRATGRVLLSTVSTQSLALLAWNLWPNTEFLRTPVAALIVLGFLLYGLGFALIIQRYRRESRWTLSKDWDNTNCILHGAMSITGLAIVYTGTLPPIVGIATWLYVLVALVLVEIVEVARMFERIRYQGLREGLLTYHVSQWSRNFTFGMFYAFTDAATSILSAPPALTQIQVIVDAVIASGAYIVLFFLLVQLALWGIASIKFGTTSALRRHHDTPAPLSTQRSD